MRKGLTILCVLICFICKGQTIQYLGSQTTQIYVRGQLRIDTLVYLPITDTTISPSQKGAFLFRTADNGLYLWTGSRWNKIAVGSTAWGQLTGSISAQTDLISLLNTYQPLITPGYGIKNATNTFSFDSAVVRKVDTMFRVNDSILSYTINGATRTVLLRGTPAGGINSLIQTLPSGLFTTPLNFANMAGAWTGTVSLINQNPGTVFAGPASGGAALPSFRALAISDLPTGIPNAYLQNSGIGFNTGTSGTDVNWAASPVALGATATLNLPNGSGTARGLLTPSNYNTFFSKIDSTTKRNDTVYDWQNGSAIFRYVIIKPLTLTTNGISGPSSFIGDTLNVPTYVGGQVQLKDTSGNLVTTHYPFAAYDITGRYISNVLTDTEYVNLWNTVQANRSSGVLALGSDSTHFTFDQTAKRVQASPITLPNQVTSATLAAWYDFTNPNFLTLVDSTRKISVAKDLSGNGRDISQSFDASRPAWVQGGGQNGLGYMQLKGAQINTSATFSIDMPLTVYIVLKPRSFADLGELMTYNASYDAIRNRAVSGAGAADSILGIANNAQYFLPGKTTYRQNSGYVFSAFISPTSPSIRINNEQPFVSAGTMGSNKAVHFNFGDYDAEIYEVIIYAGAVSASEDSVVRRYLTQKYNMSTGFAVLWFGDSITHGQNSSDIDSSSFAALVTHERGYVNANFGIPNTGIDTTADFVGVPGFNFVTVLNRQYSYDPTTSWVIMQYGTNDWFGLNEDPTGLLPIWKRKYERYIQRMVTYGFDRRRMIICSPPYQSKRYPLDTLINQTIAQIAQDLNIRYFNGYQYTKDRGGDALLSVPDSIHLTNAGHRVYANGIEEVMAGEFSYYSQGTGFFGLKDVELGSFYNPLRDNQFFRYDTIRQRLVNTSLLLSYGQNATNNSLALNYGNTQLFLPATKVLAGLLDSGRAATIDSLRNRTITGIGGSTYAPTLTSGTNVTAVTLTDASYSISGTTVHVMIRGTFTATSVNTLSNITFTLPQTASSTSNSGGPATISMNSGTAGYAAGITTLSSTTVGILSFQVSNTSATAFCINLDYQK